MEHGSCYQVAVALRSAKRGYTAHDRLRLPYLLNTELIPSLGGGVPCYVETGESPGTGFAGAEARAGCFLPPTVLATVSGVGQLQRGQVQSISSSVTPLGI